MVDVRRRKFADYLQRELCSGNALGELTSYSWKRFLQSHDAHFSICLGGTTGRYKGHPVSDCGGIKDRNGFVRYGKSR
jgi:hypothetical protein